MTSNGSRPLSLLGFASVWVLVLGLGFANGLSGFSNCLALLVPEQLDFNYCIKAAPTNFVVI